METCLDTDNVLFRYEGTGRSLSLKLLEQLRQQSAPGAKPASGEDVALVGRTLHECELKESIRLYYIWGVNYLGDNVVKGTEAATSASPG